MIYFLYGPNTFELNRGLNSLLASLTAGNDVPVERLDAGELTLRDLPDIFKGTSLFSERRVIVLKQPSANKLLWAALVDYTEVADGTELIITDSGVDKRTKPFKTLAGVAKSVEYADFGPRTVAGLERWVISEAGRRGLEIGAQATKLLIDRVGYDQWALAGAIEKLALVGDGSPERIRELIDPNPTASAFDLFETALRGDDAAVKRLLDDLMATNDPHALMGLLASQAYQLALVANSKKTPEQLAKLTGSNSSYPFQKLMPLARRLTRQKVTAAIAALAECDRDLKRSAASPWVLLTRALHKITLA